MSFKDYYRILGVAPNATHADIKKKFRMLALQYHPDRNEDSEFALVRFREVQEAYNALSNDSLRAIYDREWRLQFPTGRITTVKELSPASILEESIALVQYVRRADAYRFNRDYVLIRLTDILSTDNLAFLLHADDKQKNTEIIERSLDAAVKLPWNKIEQILPLLQQLSAKSHLVPTAIDTWKKKVRLNSVWEKYYPWVAFLIAVVICVLIFRMSN